MMSFLSLSISLTVFMEQMEGGTRLISAGHEKKLLVKVIKANNLGSKKGATWTI